MSLSAGSRLGPYEILGLIGAGGMGEVYRANDTRLQRTVAIKTLRRERTAEGGGIKRFLQEARAASALNHPNIITLYDIANEAGVDYLVMEYMSGQSLDKLITPGGMRLSDALEYAQQIASGLAAAHGAGIIHRDMKPANVVVGSESQVKILDFGLAKLLERSPDPEGDTISEVALTERGTVMGTIAYMSPEQVSGLALDHRTDIFSLGIMLHEMLGGTRPFGGKSRVDVMHAIVHEPAPQLSGYPAELQEILDKALAKELKDRYQHAGDFGIDLRRFQKAWQSKSLPSMRPIASAPARKSYRWAAIGAAIAAAAVFLAAGWFLGGRQAPAANPLGNAQFTRLTDFQGSENEAAISRDGRFVVFRSDRDGPVDTWVSQIGSGQFVNLTHGARPSVLVRNAGFTPEGEIWFSSLVGGDRLRKIPLMGGTLRPFLGEHAQNVAWSRDGTQLVFHDNTPGDPMFVADNSGSNPRQIFTLKAGGHNHFPLWSANGAWIYFVSGVWDAKEMDIWRIRPAGGAPERLTHNNNDVRYLALLDDRNILYVSPDRNGAGPWLWSLDPSTKVSRRLSSGLEVYTSVDASADGHRLVATVASPTANLWSFPILDRSAEEADVKPYPLPSLRAHSPRFGGAALFYLSSRSGGDGVWRYDNGQAAEIWRGSEGALFEPPAVSPDGNRLAIVLRKQSRRTLFTLSSEGVDVRPLAPALEVTGAASWSPDGRWIAVGGIDSNGPGLFKIPLDGGDAVRLTRGIAANPVWSPDGSVIVYTGAVVGVMGPLLFVHPDGSPADAPAVRVGVGSERYRFVPGTRQLVFIPTTSQAARDTFWLLDLSTKKTRLLGNFDSRATQTFDITPDGKQVILDRLHDNSNVVLIERTEEKQ